MSIWVFSKNVKKKYASLKKFKYASGKIKEMCRQSQANTKPNLHVLQTEGVKEKWSQTL